MKIVYFAAFLTVASAGMAMAQDQAPPMGGRMPECREDSQKLCPDKHGPDRRACMEANKDKLSDACKKAMSAMMSKP